MKPPSQSRPAHRNPTCVVSSMTSMVGSALKRCTLQRNKSWAGGVVSTFGSVCGQKAS